MLPLAVVIGVVLWSVPAEAIRWDFDDGTTQGWAAKSGMSWGPSVDFKLYSGEVADGVWKIDISSSGNVEVISSFIGYDSHLFDQVRVRFRSVHDSPTVGGFLLTWTNEHNLITPGGDPEGGYQVRFLTSGQRGFVYTTEWQEVEIVLPTSDDETEKIWEGMLQDIRLRFSVGGPADGVEFFEIDWIELTGVEERLQGELSPPYVGYFRFNRAGLFAPPVFYPITPGLGSWDTADGRHSSGVLTDLDGDGDLDLFSIWQRGFDRSASWVMALNDGRGAFEKVRSEAIEQNIWGVLVGDVTGDGQDEIALYLVDGGVAVAVWSIGSDFQIEELMQVSDRSLVDIADVDGDRDGELFAIDYTETGFFLEVWDIEHGVWTASQSALPKNYWPSQVGDFTGDGMLDVLWTPLSIGGLNPCIVAPVGTVPDLQGGTLFEFDYFVPLSRYQLFDNVVAGDFDGDGQADLLTSLRLTSEGRRGLVLRRSQREAQVLYDERLFVRSSVLVRDLDADGVDDWVFVGGNRASGVGVFIAWGGVAGIPHEVETHRLAGDGVEVLPGDVDGDGDLDLVVLDHLYDGVHVLKSLGGAQPTAVQTTAAAQPARHRLGHSYPNPFNPRVVIPLDLATDEAEVSLTVYDVLGRRVRQLWQGPLGAGTHRFVWDGRDAEGKAVAAGVYVYQVAVDGQIAANKTTKLP